MIPRCLHFDEIAPGRDFHAALAADFPRRQGSVAHTHDFGEVMYVLEGIGMHAVNSTEHPLRAGDLLWIRPPDVHTFYTRPGQKLYFINIAFRQNIWTDFRRLAIETPGAAPWESCPDPFLVALPPARRAGCVHLFQEMLRGFHTHPTRLALCRFWAEVLPLLLPPAAGPVDSAGPPSPPWLSRACLALQSADALQAGVPRLVDLCGVSPAHLARTLKAVRGQTPTEFVNSLRLEQAAILLATTTSQIIEIASECGFDNLSYFYRLFQRRFGQSPRRYRLDTRRTVQPENIYENNA